MPQTTRVRLTLGNHPRGDGSAAGPSPTVLFVSTAAPSPTCNDVGRTCSADVGRVVARIHGALGSMILVGLDRLTICRCAVPSTDLAASRRPWFFDELAGVEIAQYGSLPVVLLRPISGADPLPALLLERGQVGPALDGLVTLRRLIADATRERSLGEAVQRKLATIVELGRDL